jgi:hypothetical protein
MLLICRVRSQSDTPDWDILYRWKQVKSNRGKPPPEQELFGVGEYAEKGKGKVKAVGGKKTYGASLECDRASFFKKSVVTHLFR